MSKLGWVVLAIAMAGLGGYACGSDDGGSGGNNPGGGGHCVTDPEGAACGECGMKALVCLGQGTCADEFQAVGSCLLANCTGEEECTACNGEQTEYRGCLTAKCEGIKGCY